MQDSLLLQLFLLFNVLLVGAFSAIALRHALAHFRPHRDAEKHPGGPHPPQLPAAVKRKMIEEAEAQYERTLTKTVSELEKELKSTALRLNDKLEKVGSHIVDEEMKRYQKTLDSLRQQTEEALSAAQLKVADHQRGLDGALEEQQSRLEAKLEADIATRRDELMQQIDTKLADAMASFLSNTLGHNVDLGAQQGYLLSVLDEHKEEFKRELSDEATTAK